MQNDRIYRLGDLQLRIMKVLWGRGPTGVAEVRGALNDDVRRESRLAYTTVATMLRKMEDRGLLAHREDGRRFIYEAAVGEDVVTRSMAGDMVDRLFAGSLAAAVSHLLESRDVSSEDLAGLERLIRKRKQQPARE